MSFWIRREPNRCLGLANLALGWTLRRCRPHLRPRQEVTGPVLDAYAELSFEVYVCVYVYVCVCVCVYTLMRVADSSETRLKGIGRE